MRLSDKITKVIEATTPASVHTYTGIPYSTANRLKNGHIKVKNITLETAEKIGAYADLVLK